MRVLLVAADNDDAVFLKTCLRRQDARSIELVRVDRMADAVVRLHEEPFDVVLIDLDLPDSTGQDSVHRIQSSDPAIPIVVLSGQDDVELAVAASWLPNVGHNTLFRNSRG